MIVHWPSFTYIHRYLLKVCLSNGATTQQHNRAYIISTKTDCQSVLRMNTTANWVNIIILKPAFLCCNFEIKTKNWCESLNYSRYSHINSWLCFKVEYHQAHGIEQKFDVRGQAGPKNISKTFVHCTMCMWCC